MNKLVVVAWTIMLCGCRADSDDGTRGPLVITHLDTLVSTESGLLGLPFDLAFTQSGSVLVADFQAPEITVVEPDRSIRSIGGPGEGPGEFAGVWGLQVAGNDVLVVDRGNGRIQRMGLDGSYLESWPVSPLVRSSFPYLLPDGGILLGSMGRDSTLAYAFAPRDPDARGIGVPVAPVPETRDYPAIKEAISRGEIPDEIRNEALVAGTGDGRVWIALQTEGILQRYSPDGALEWALDVEAPEMEAVREQFFLRNQAEERPNRFYSLRYFADLCPAGEALWVLLTTPETAESAVVLVVGQGGAVQRRLEIRGAGGATALAVDPRGERIVLATPHDAQVVVASDSRQ